MIDIAVNELNKFYGSSHVLKGISFEIYDGERVGLLGKNGSGKTTLFKILSEQELFESGTVFVPKNKNAEVLDQIPCYPEGFSALDVIKTAFERIIHISEEMRHLEEQMQICHQDEYLKKYGLLQTEFEALEGYEMESSIEMVCNGLGINEEMRGKPFNILSGGEKTRVNLARVLLKRADILLLDEPTNHLDIKAIQWLEEFLLKYKGTILVISHDRFFLDKIIDRVIELNEGIAEFYKGNYSNYVVEKENRFLSQMAQFQEQSKKIGQLEKAAKRMHEWAKQADNPAMHKRAFNIEKRIERMEKIEKPAEEQKINGEFRPSGFSGKDVVIFREVSKAYDTKRLWDTFDNSIQKDERVAILGDNGTGKTTLLKLISGEEQPDKGTVRVGESIKPAYLKQVITFEKPGMTVLETARYELETSEEKARSILAAFNFKGKDLIKKVDALSGGEKSRLSLCLLMQKGCNLLLLDEPTNHLDITSKEWIEKAVSKFKGTVVFVSHDRYFINRFATRIWEIGENGIWDFKGTYGEFNDFKKGIEIEKVRNKAIGEKTVKPETSTKKAERDIEKDKSNIEFEISELDSEIRDIELKMEEETRDYKHLEELLKDKNRILGEIDKLYERWMEL